MQRGVHLIYRGEVCCNTTTRATLQDTRDNPKFLNGTYSLLPLCVQTLWKVQLNQLVTSNQRIIFSDSHLAPTTFNLLTTLYG
mgnify:FL=1